jgi:hypothetical protein
MSAEFLGRKFQLLLNPDRDKYQSRFKAFRNNRNLFRRTFPTLHFLEKYLLYKHARRTKFYERLGSLGDEKKVLIMCHNYRSQ